MEGALKSTKTPGTSWKLAFAVVGREIFTIAYHQHLCSPIMPPWYALHGVRFENERGHR